MLLLYETKLRFFFYMYIFFTAWTSALTSEEPRPIWDFSTSEESRKTGFIAGAQALTLTHASMADAPSNLSRRADGPRSDRKRGAAPLPAVRPRTPAASKSRRCFMAQQFAG